MDERTLIVERELEVPRLSAFLTNVKCGTLYLVTGSGH